MINALAEWWELMHTEMTLHGFSFTCVDIYAFTLTFTVILKSIIERDN